MKIINVFFAVLLIVFSGCGGSKRIEVPQKKLPYWYEKPPRTSSTEFYSVGEGKTKRSAIDNALALIASTFNVSISSSYSSKLVVTDKTSNSSVDSTYINETRSKVNTIKIFNYKLIDSKKLGFKRFAVLVSVNKIKLFSGIKNDLEQKFELISEEEKNYFNVNALQRLAFYKKSLQKLSGLENDLSVLKNLKNSFDDSIYIRKRSLLRQKYNKLHNKISFEVDAVNSSAKKFIKVIESSIGAKNFKLLKVHNKEHFTIFIKGNIKSVKSYGFNIARAELSFTVKDYKGIVISTNVVHINGQSSQGYMVAQQDLVKKLDIKIKQDGLAKVLNLNIY